MENSKITKNSSPILVLCYPRCSTCTKALKWLDENGIDYIKRDIAVNNPNADELTKWIAASGLSLKRFFNTSGMLYRQMNIKDKLPQMSDAEAIELLATDGMLVKRPLVVTPSTILVGFRPAEWESALL